MSITYIDCTEEDCSVPGGRAIRTEVIQEWMKKLPRQQRRNLEREAQKRGETWLYHILSGMKMRGELS